MSQKIDIKVAIDAADSVKTIKEARQALKDLRSAALQVEEGSASFQQIQAAAGNLQDRIADLQQTTRFFADDLRTLSGLKGIAEGIAGGFALAQGAITLFGNQNEDLEKSLVKLNSVMAILNGLTALGNVIQKESSAVLLIQTTLRKSLTAVVGRQAVAEAAEAVAAGTATIAQRALNAAMNANPVGILITLILAGVAALTLWSNTSDEASKETKKQNDELNSLAEAQSKENAGLISLTGQLKLTVAGSKERSAIITEINSKYGTTLKNLKDEKEFQDQINNLVVNYIALQKVKFAAKSKEAELQNSLERQALNENLLAAETAKMEKLQAEQNALNFDERKKLIQGAIDGFTNLIKKEEEYQKGVAQEQLDLYKKEQDALKAAGITKKGDADASNKQAEANKNNNNSLNNLIKSYEDLTALTKEYNLEATTLYLERVKKTLTEEVNLRELKFNEELANLTSKSNKVIQKIIDEEVAVLKTQKDYAIKKGENEAEYTKRLEGIINERFKNDKNYADKAKIIEDNKLALTKDIEERKQRFILDTNNFITEQQEAQLQSAKKVAEEILSPAQFFIFFKGISKAMGDIKDITDVSLESFNTAIISLNEKLIGTLSDNQKTLIQENKAYNDIILNGGKDITDKLNEIQKNSYTTNTDLIKDLLKLTKDYQNDNLNDTELFMFKIGVFYQDKFNLIKQVEEQIKKSSGIEKSFFEASSEQIEKQVALLKEQNILKAEDFASTEEYYNELLKLAKERLTFTVQDNETLSKALEERYNTLITTEKNFYTEGLNALVENNSQKKITDEEYIKGLEDLQTKHNDNLLNIEVAYGKKSLEDVANRRKAIIEEQKTENKEKEDLLKAAADKEIELRKKVANEYLSVERELQNALFELFQRTQEQRERTAQATYDNEISRIEAAEKKYEDSLANRTAAEQADYDVKAGFAEQRQNAEKRFNDEKNRIAQKAFTAQKVNDLSTITIQTAVAIAKTIAELGGVGAITPPGLALIAAVAAQGAIQASLVASQQFIPQYATGGMVSGPGTGTSDSVLVRVSNGESIINARSTKKYQPILSAINVDGGGKSFAPGFANGGMVDMTTYSSKDNMTIIKELLLEINNRPIETYVKQTVVENASQKSQRLKNRTTFG